MPSDPKQMLADLRAAMDAVEDSRVPSLYVGRIVFPFLRTHGPALLARLEGCEALRAQYEAAVRVLRPFGHPDLTELMGGNVQGDASPVYQRNNALLTVGDFRRAAAVLSHPLAKEVAE